jgi:DNA-binding transcriptional regulator YhcF (GntR family)
MEEHSEIKKTPKNWQAKRRPISDELGDKLRSDIYKGIYVGRMPSMDILASDYGVSRVTLRNVLLSLQEEGIVTIRQGSGTFVRTIELPTTNEKPTVPLVFAQALGRYLDFLVSPNISNVTKTRMVGIVDSQLQLALELGGVE